MITLRINPYSKQEVRQLANLLTEMEEIMFNFCKPGENCKTCEYRHICYDITSAKEHAIKLTKREELPEE